MYWLIVTQIGNLDDYSTVPGVGLVLNVTITIDNLCLFCYNKLMTVRSLRTPLVLFAALALVVTTIVVLGANTHAASFDMGMTQGAAAAKGKDMATDLFGQTGTFRTITNVMLYLIGAISVIMLIIGGLRYVVSGGDSTAVQNAKNTILYAVVGIIVAILAYAVVSFVITSFSGNGGGSAATGTSIAPPTNT